MIRKLRVLGLALAAVFAMTAIAASAASAAAPNFTADGYPAFFTGANTPGAVHALTTAGLEIECTESTYEAELAAASPTLTIRPAYEKCMAGATKDSTVTMNECDYQFATMEKEGEKDTWPVTSFLKCPAGKKAEIHVYKTKEHSAANLYCTLTFAEQGPLSGITVHLETPSAVRITGTVKATGETHGECSFNLTVNIAVELHVDATVKCENKNKETTNCDIG